MGEAQQEVRRDEEAGDAEDSPQAAELRRNISDKNEEIEHLRRRLEQRSREMKKLIGWFESLDAGVSAILNSRRWKAGSFIGDTGRRMLRRPDNPPAVDLVNKVSGQFRAWRKAYDREPVHPEGEGGGGSSEIMPSQSSTSTASEPGAGGAPEAVSGVRKKDSRLGPKNENGIKRVQVGCGPHNIMEDWWNVDIRKFRGIDEVMDATKPWPYKDLEYVFGEHFLEHLALDDAVKFLTHAGNSLRDGGAVRLSTPNLEMVLHTHYEFGEVELTKRLSDTLKTNRAFHGWGHQFLYSKEMLGYILNELNFEEVVFFSYGESNDPELKDLERHGGPQEYDGHPSVIIAEARRGRERITPSPELLPLLEKEFLRYVASGH